MESVTSDTLFSLHKGEPGTRKSTACVSYPTPQYWVSADQKMEALRLPMKEFGVKPADVEFDDYSDYDSMNKKLEALRVNCKYKTINIDSITSIGDNVNRQTRRLKSGTTTQAGSEKGKRIGGITVNSMEDFNAEASAFQEMIAQLKDIHKHFGVNINLIAHVIGARKTDDSNQTTHFARIIVTGGQIISAKIPAYCTEVYHYNIENDMDISKGGKYALYTEHMGNDFARTSLPLERKIIFNNQPLYKDFIQPAIEKLNKTTTLSTF